MAVVNLIERGRSPLADVQHMLRNLADMIERGEYGDTKDPDLILRCICVIRASRMEPIVLGFGASADPIQAFSDLHAGAHTLLMMGHPERT